jgi:hypothetical protein
MEDFAPYRIRGVQRLPSQTGLSSWSVTFVRREGEVIDMNMDSIAFVGLDLDRDYAAADLMDLRELGSVESST